MNIIKTAQEDPEEEVQKRKLVKIVPSQTNNSNKELLNLQPTKPKEEPKPAKTFAGFFSDSKKFNSFLNQKVEVSNKEEFAGFLSSGKNERKESEEEDKDDLAGPLEATEVDFKPITLASSPYTKIFSVIV